MPKVSQHHFWTSVEDAIIGLHETMQLTAMSRSAIRNLAPLLLGAPAWAQLSHYNHILDWDAFKQLVEDEFGISEELEK